MDRVPTFALFVVRLDGWYQGRVWRGASMAARLLGVRLVAIVGSAYGDPLRRGGPPEIFDLAQSERIDGYLPLVGALGNLQGSQAVEGLLERLPPRPTVCVGLSLPGRIAVVPEKGGVEAVVRHLAGHHGLDRICYLGGPARNPDSIRRKSDFVKAMREAGLVPREEEMPEGDFSPDRAYEAMAEVFDRHGVPQAVVCANDAMALGVRRLCRDRGLRVPEDVALTGFDDAEEASTMVPSLTTVDSSAFQVAFRSVELAYAQWRGEPAATEELPTEIVIRASCGCRPAPFAPRLPRLLAEAAGVPETSRIREILSDPETARPFLARLGAAFETADHAELDFWEERIVEASGPGPSRGGIDGFVQAVSAVSRARHRLDTRRRHELQALMREEQAAARKLSSGTGEDDLPTLILQAFPGLADHHLRILLFREDGAPLAHPGFGTEPFRLEIDVVSGRIGRPASDPLLPPGGLPQANWVVLSLTLADEHFGIVQVRDWNSNELFLESLRCTLSMALSLRWRARR